MQKVTEKQTSTFLNKTESCNSFDILKEMNELTKLCFMARFSCFLGGFILVVYCYESA